MTIQTWMLGLAQAGLGVSAAAVLLALAQRALRLRVAARWFCIVWLALAVRLVIAVPLPALVRLPVPGAVGEVFAQTDETRSARPQADAGRAEQPLFARPDAAADAPDAAGTQEGLQSPAGDGTEPAVPAPEGSGAGAGGQTPAAVWLFAVWAAGCGGVLAVRCAGHLHYRRQLLRWALPPDERQRRLLAREAAGLGPHRPVQLVQSGEGPLLLGLIHPVLALPPLPADGPDPEDGDLVLIVRHELAHLARHDLAFKALLTVACALHWVNPLVWWMARRASAEMELACDDAVTQNASPAQRRSYGEAIIAAASRRQRAGRPGPALCTGFWGGRSGMRRRFENLVNGPAVPRRRAWAAFCLLAAGVLAGSWLLGAAAARPGQEAQSVQGMAASVQPGAVSQPGALDAAEPWQETMVDFARNRGAFAAPVFDAVGDEIIAMQCEKRGSPEHWQREDAAVKLSLLLPEGWAVHPAAEGEEVFASGNGTEAPFNLTDAAGDWVGTMQYGSFTADQVQDEGGFYGSGSHAAYYWLWANPGGFGWDEASCRPAAGDAALDDPQAAGALLCETTGSAQAGHEGVLAHNGALGRFVVIELRAGVLSEEERLRLAESIQLLAGDTPAGTVPGLPEEPALPEGYAWQTAELVVTGAPTESRTFSEQVTVRLALPEGCTLRLEEPESARTAGPAGAVILRGGETVGRIECITFAAPAPLDWPVENPREIYATLMMSAHAGWDYDYEEIARSETVSIATCLVGREAYPHGPGPEAPPAGQEPENFKDGWWYQKGILCADNALGVYAAVELSYSEFSDTVRLAIAQSLRLAAG